MKDATIDFETEKSQDRPLYPPKPVGLAARLPGKPHVYAAWGHPTNNGVYELRDKKLVKLRVDDPKKYATQAYKQAVKGKVRGYHLRFDLDVGETHMGVKLPAWQDAEDGMFARFLVDPHAPDLKLKNAAERVLGDKPAERDAVFDWLAAHGFPTRPSMRKGELKYPKDAGAYISKAPGDLVALYAIGDLTRTDDLYDHDMKVIKQDSNPGGYNMLDAYRREQRVSRILLKNERAGMRVNVDLLEHDLPKYEKALAKCEEWLRKKLKASTMINWDSDDEVATVLKKSGQVKRFPKTPTGKDSVAKSNLTKEFFRDPNVYLALCWRNLTAYVLSQNIRPWLQTATLSGGYIYAGWNQVRNDEGSGARSGRITVSKWANIIRDPTEGKNPDYLVADDARIRALIGLPEVPLARIYCLPDEDGLFGHADWNQQELRLVAHYEDGALAQAYRDNPRVDIHQFVTDLIHKATLNLFKRNVIKHTNFRTAYGGGEAGLVIHPHLRFDRMFHCEQNCPHKRCEARQMAHKVLSSWKAALPDVVELDNALKQRFRDGLHIRTFGGRIYHCKPPAVIKKGPRKGQLVHFEYTALNYLIQPSGADMCKMAIINYEDHPKRRGRMLNMVYDEVNVSTPAAKTMKARIENGRREMKVLQECLEAVKLEVPTIADTELKEAWGSKAIAA